MRQHFLKCIANFELLVIFQLQLLLLSLLFLIWLFPINQWAGLVPIILILIASLVYSRFLIINSRKRP